MFEFLAQATTQQVVEVSPKSQWAEFWLSVLLPVGSILGTMLALYLKKLLAKVTAEKDKADLEGGQILINRLKTFLLDNAVAIAEEKFPVVAREVLEGKIRSAQDVHRVMNEWAQILKEKAVRHFDGQGVKLDEWLAPETLEDLVRRSADQASPFPGMVTANVVTQPKVAKDLLDRGVQYVRENYQEYRANFDDIRIDPEVAKAVDSQSKDPKTP